jgi:hypothetical protein
LKILYELKLMTAVKYRVLSWCDLLQGKTTRDTCQRGIENIRKKLLLVHEHLQAVKYRGADKSLARPTSLSIFQSREQVVIQRGQIRRIGWVIKTLEA